MAKAELDILLDKLSGRLTGDSKFYSTHRHGKTVISNYPLHKDPKTISATQRANSSCFGQRSKQATSELADPEVMLIGKNGMTSTRNLLTRTSLAPIPNSSDPTSSNRQINIIPHSVDLLLLS